MTSNYWHGCEQGFPANVKKDFMLNLLRQTIGFAGCKMMRKQMGIAHVIDIESIEDLSLRAKAERLVIIIARKLVTRYDQFNSIDELMECVGASIPAK